MASYWAVDPEKPSITVWELEGGRFTQARVVSGDDEMTVERPFPMTVASSALVA